jgi:hypothetical protein
MNVESPFELLPTLKKLTDEECAAIAEYARLCVRRDREAMQAQVTALKDLLAKITDGIPEEAIDKGLTIRSVCDHFSGILDVVSKSAQDSLIKAFQLEDEVKRLRAVIKKGQPATASEDPWLPLETAPANGDCMLRVETDDGVQIMTLERDKEGNWLYEGQPTFCASWYIRPTHWKPKPSTDLTEEQQRELDEQGEEDE